MTLAFRPAVRENVGLFVGFAGGTGSGKTMSAMRCAQGIVGRANKFAVIDTENGRARHYAPKPGEEPDFVTTFRFDVLDLTSPFSPARYEETVKLAVQEGYKAIVLDSATHEHDGEGGYLDMQADDLKQRVDRYMKKYPQAKEWEVIEKLTPSSWVMPKRERKRMMQTLLACSTSIPILFCFRAEEKVFSTKDGKLVANNPPIWAPICGKGMPFEMTAFMMLHREHPGVPVPIKLQEQHRALFPLDQPINEETGKLISQWAAGAAPRNPTGESSLAPSAPASGQPKEDALITPEQAVALEMACQDAGIPLQALKDRAEVNRLGQILARDYEGALAWIAKRKKK